jgi:DNA segregation ATPase FtsK/SpoIIIE-like protein
MKYEHKAIVDAAAREGKTPAELAKELLGHDLLKAMVTSISKPAVAFSKMSQQQQESVIEDLKKEMAPAVATAIEVICSQSTHTIRMTLKKMAVGKDYQITGTVNKAQDFIHELMDKTHDQSDVLIVLHERDYMQGMDVIKGEKDQKALPLEGEADGGKPKGKASAKGDPAAKVIELPPALIDQAEAFVRNIQTATHAGVQNQFKINFEKAEALLQALEDRGVITEKDKDGNRALVRVKAAAPAAEATTEAEATAETEETPDQHALAPLPCGADGLPIMSTALFELAKAKVIKDQTVSAGGLAVAFDLTDPVAADLIDRLELEGVISEESDLGTREVYSAA